MRKKIALIDADVLAYQAAVVSERPVKWGNDLWTLHSFESEAQEHFAHMVVTITAKAGCDSAILAWSDTENFRKDVLPTYKSNRKDTRKPLTLAPIRVWGQETYESVIIPNLEGDDVLGLLATENVPNGFDYVICTIDKDLKTIPSNHYNFGKDLHFTTTLAEADYYHMTQTLTGDATDGYKGCPSVGAVGAKKILDDALALAKSNDHEKFNNWYMWIAVVKAFEKAGLGEEEALVQARVARILRTPEYDHKKRKVKLWSPPKMKIKQ